MKHSFVLFAVLGLVIYTVRADASGGGKPSSKSSFYADCEERKGYYTHSTRNEPVRDSEKKNQCIEVPDDVPDKEFNKNGTNRENESNVDIQLSPRFLGLGISAILEQIFTPKPNSDWERNEERIEGESWQKIKEQEKKEWQKEQTRKEEEEAEESKGIYVVYFVNEPRGKSLSDEELTGGNPRFTKDVLEAIRNSKITEVIHHWLTKYPFGIYYVRFINNYLADIPLEKGEQIVGLVRPIKPEDLLNQDSKTKYIALPIELKKPVYPSGDVLYLCIFDDYLYVIAYIHGQVIRDKAFILRQKYPNGGYEIHYIEFGDSNGFQRYVPNNEVLLGTISSDELQKLPICKNAGFYIVKYIKNLEYQHVFHNTSQVHDESNYMKLAMRQELSTAIERLPGYLRNEILGAIFKNKQYRFQRKNIYGDSHYDLEYFVFPISPDNKKIEGVLIDNGENLRAYMFHNEDAETPYIIKYPKHILERFLDGKRQENVNGIVRTYQIQRFPASGNIYFASHNRANSKFVYQMNPVSGYMEI